MAAGDTGIDQAAVLVQGLGGLGDDELVLHVGGEVAHVVGDAAGFCVNMGFTVRGMDFAIESGRLAAETVIHAKTVGDFSADTLKMYRTLLNQSFVIKDMQSLKGFPTLLSRREIFRDVPDMTDDIATKLFTVDGKPSMDFLMYVINSFTSHTTVAQLSEFASTILNAF